MTIGERAATVAAARHPCSAWKNAEERLWSAVLAAADPAAREAASRDYIDHHMNRGPHHDPTVVTSPAA